LTEPRPILRREIQLPRADPAARGHRWNGSAVRIFGHSPGKIIGQAGIGRFVARNLLYTDLSDAIGVLLGQ